MAFSYTPLAGANSPGQGLDYAQATKPQYQFQPTNTQPAIDPTQLVRLYQQFSGAGSGEQSNGGLSGLLGMGGDLMGGSSGAMPAAENGGASYGIGGSLVGGSGEVGGSTYAGSQGSGQWDTLKSIIMSKFQ